MHRWLASSSATGDGGAPGNSDACPDRQGSLGSAEMSERVSRPRDRRGAASGPPNSSYSATSRSVGCLAVATNTLASTTDTYVLLVRLKWTRSGFQRLLALLTEDIVPERSAENTSATNQHRRCAANSAPSEGSAARTATAANALRRELHQALSNCNDAEIELLATAALGGTPAHRRRHGVAPVENPPGNIPSELHLDSRSHFQQRPADHDTVMSERSAVRGPGQGPTPTSDLPPFQLADASNSVIAEEGPDHPHSDDRRPQDDMDSTEQQAESRLSFAEEGFLCEVWFNKDIPESWRAEHKRAVALQNFMAHVAVHVIRAADGRAEGERPPADLLSRHSWTIPCGPLLPHISPEDQDEDGFAESKAVFCHLTRIPPELISRARPVGETLASGARHSTEAFLVTVTHAVKAKSHWEVFGPDTVEARWFSVDTVQRMWFTKSQRSILDQAYRICKICK